MTNAEVVREYIAAQIALDLDGLSKLRHPDWVARWPQSGEVVRGDANMRQIIENYPGGAPRLTTGRLIGSEDRWATSPVGGAYRVAGEGDSWFADYMITYPDGREWFTTILMEIRDGLIYRETEYWSEPFDPPAWRSAWVEPLAEDNS